MSEQPYLRMHCSPGVQEGPRKGGLNKVCSLLYWPVSCYRRYVHLYRRKKSKFLSKNYDYKFASWNIRTLIDREETDRPERRTALVAKELDRYGVDIAGLSETRLSDENHLIEVGAGFTFFWKGKPAGVKREGGVGFAIKSTLVDLIEQPCAFSDRIMTLRLALSAKRYITIISAYAPTMTNDEETIISFYTLLSSVISEIPKSDKILLLGDFNARVGQDNDTWDCLGPYGIGKTVCICCSYVHNLIFPS